MPQIQTQPIIEYVFHGITIYLSLLAVFDATMDFCYNAVDCPNSAIGAKASGFTTFIINATVGIFGLTRISDHDKFVVELMCHF